MDYYYLFYTFFIYSFIGWCCETAYASVLKKQFINRGFLNGPFCPIYGVGAVLVFSFINPINKINFSNEIIKTILLMIYVAVVASIIEYFTGYLLEKFFNATWWDYSEKKFNIKGRICLSFSILWGVSVYLIWKYIHPLVVFLVNLISVKIGIIILVAFGIYFIVDGFITVKSLIDFNNILGEIKKLAGNIKIDINVSNKKQMLLDKKDKLRQRYNELTKFIAKKYSRFFKAYPNIKSLKFQNIINNIKKIIKKD